ncbi:unnamed protein product [Phytophthora lilii]|uniref:Unnamed protein product n=1 Tax=Phytophthora lilii TaxID=2077276 RepID=A0A9W6TKF4_9STRA|nr:unnamed protein product [Phytophthora lilii]
MLAQMLQFALQTTQQQSTQMSQLLAQTAQIQQQNPAGPVTPQADPKEIGPAALRGRPRRHLPTWSLLTCVLMPKLGTETSRSHKGQAQSLGRSLKSAFAHATVTRTLSSKRSRKCKSLSLASHSRNTPPSTPPSSCICYLNKSSAVPTCARKRKQRRNGFPEGQTIVLPDPDSTDRRTSCPVFVDSGSSFNAVSPYLAKKLELKVQNRCKPLTLEIGNNQRVKIPRHEAVVSQFRHGRVSGVSDSCLRDSHTRGHRFAAGLAEIQI